MRARCTVEHRRSIRRRNRGHVANGAHPPILGVDPSGRPFDWLPWQDAVRHVMLDQILWTVGDPSIVIYGGRGRDGMQSSVALHPVIALRGADAGPLDAQTPPLTSRVLFARDRHTCLYCGREYPVRQLTFDHVTPRSRGGSNGWANAATACVRCNNHKADRTPEEAGMPLLAVPYAPNYAESLILANRRILVDQMAFLRSRVPAARRDRY